ncbi:MAG: hypothetical protein GXX00_08105 [Hungateiclostridium thermocellum]|nr:hypothetical protein [Acetivibrio thermocellus]
MNDLMERKDIIPTKRDGYALTDNGKKLLEVLINPEHYGKSVTEKCRIAGISRDSYYRLMKEPGFVYILNEASIDLIRSHVNDILQATLKFSLKDPKCHSDRKMLLQKCGIIEDNNGLEGNIMIIRFED